MKDPLVSLKLIFPINSLNVKMEGYGRVPIHSMCYVFCPALREYGLNYKGSVVKLLRHFLYTNELALDTSLVDMIHLYELGIILNLPQLSNRVLKFIPKVLTTESFDNGYKVVFESEHNDEKKMDSRVSLFENFYLENTGIIDSSDKKLLNIVKSSTELTVGDDDFGKIIQVTKLKLWKSKIYKDLTLICLDGVSIDCHKAVIGICQLFSNFDKDTDPKHYVVEFKSIPLFLFFEILYTRKLDFKGVTIDVLFDVYHICNQKEFNDLCLKVLGHLFSLLNADNYSQMFDFYIFSGLDDKKYLLKIHEYISSTFHDAVHDK